MSAVDGVKKIASCAATTLFIASLCAINFNPPRIAITCILNGTHYANSIDANPIDAANMKRSILQSLRDTINQPVNELSPEFLSHNSGRSEQTNRRRFFLGKSVLTVCTMAKDEVAYIVEWVEFMRIQGVQQFVIYDDGSRDNITLLKQFYEQNDPECLVHVS